MKRITLNQEWKFSKLQGQSIENPQEAEGVFHTVNLPHTWYQDDDQYRGLSVYVKEVNVEEYTHGCGAVAIPSALQVNPHTAVSVNPVMAVVYFLDLPQNL